MGLTYGDVSDARSIDRSMRDALRGKKTRVYPLFGARLGGGLYDAIGIVALFSLSSRAGC